MRHAGCPHLTRLGFRRKGVDGNTEAGIEPVRHLRNELPVMGGYLKQKCAAVKIDDPHLRLAVFGRNLENRHLSNPPLGDLHLFGKIGRRGEIFRFARILQPGFQSIYAGEGLLACVFEDERIDPALETWHFSQPEN